MQYTLQQVTICHSRACPGRNDTRVAYLELLTPSSADCARSAACGTIESRVCYGLRTKDFRPYAAPISVVGTGPDLNAATDNGLARAAELLGMSVPEVKNRATITGAIEIGRHPGVVQVTFRAPLDRLEKLGLLPFIRDQYGIG
jgi:hypothetical protein